MKRIFGSFSNHFIGYAFIAFMALFSGFFFISASNVLGVNERLFNGDFTSKYEDQLSEVMPHYNNSVSIWNNLKYTLFKEGRSGILIEEDGWLFSAEEFYFSENYKENIETNKNYILSVHQEFKSNNIELFVVPVPSKAIVYKKYLKKYKIPSYREYLYPDFITFLSDGNISHIDLLDVFKEAKEDTFLRADTHWSPYGARLAAKNIAGIVKAKNTRLSSDVFSSAKHETIAHEGDLATFSSKHQIKPDQVDVWRTVNQNESDLFSEQNYDVLLVGTSYSANSLWNFEGFLKEYLQSDVLNLSNEGRGPFEVMSDYLQKDYLNQVKPKIVIWEIPERYLPIFYNYKKI